MSMHHEYIRLNYDGPTQGPGCEPLCNHCRNQLLGDFKIPCQIMESRKNEEELPAGIASDDCLFFRLDLEKFMESASKKLLREI